MSSPVKSFIVAIDLDSTLYHTDKAKQAITNILKAYGHDFVITNADQIYDAEGHYHFDLFAYLHARQLDDLANAIEEEYLKLSAPNELLYSDVAPWLTALLERQAVLNIELQIVIVTRGAERFQSLKIASAPLLAKYQTLSPIISLEPKRQILAERFTGMRGVLIDDKDQRPMPTGFAFVLLERQVVDTATAVTTLADLTLDKLLSL